MSNRSRPHRLPFSACSLSFLAGCAALMPGTASRASGPAVALNRAQLAKPVVVTAADVAWTQPLAALIGDSAARNTSCHTRTTAAPIARFRIEEPIDDLLITVQPKDGHTEFFVVGERRFWEQCNGYTMEQPPTEWTPGTYDIYPTSGNGAFTVTFSSASALAAGGASGATKIVIDEKLVKPKLVTLKGRPDRAFLPDSVAGKNCSQFAMPAALDVSIEVKTMEHVVVRRLPTRSDVILGVGTGTERYCKDAKEQPAEYALTAETGALSLSLGSVRAESTPELTLMITDENTELDELALNDLGDAPTIQDRDVHLYFPQLQLRHLAGRTSWAEQAKLAQLFAAAPRKIWVYANAELGSGETTIAKGEPLLVWSAEHSRADVVTLDGLIVQVRTVGLATAAPGAITWPKAPHELKTTESAVTSSDYFDFLTYLPPADAEAGRALQAEMARWDACRDAAFAPYAARLPVAPAGYEIIKNEAYLRIEDAGHAAQDKKCGSARAFGAKMQSRREKIWKLITKARTQQLAELTARLGG